MSGKNCFKKARFEKLKLLKKSVKNCTGFFFPGALNIGMQNRRKQRDLST